MYCLKSIRKIKSINFLCGPYTDLANGKDRRNIIYKWSKNKKTERPFFIIVDNLFNKSGYIKKYNISFKLIEEIISLLSDHTYIFLDTLSSAYELGLFNTNFSNNKITIFADSGRKESKTLPKIGEYIRKSFDENNIIEYDASYDSAGNIFFKDNKIPKNIMQKFLDDLQNDDDSIYFEVGENIDINVAGNIRCYYNNELKNIHIKVGIKTLFYILCAIRNKTRKKEFKLCKKDEIIESTKKIIMDLCVDQKPNIFYKSGYFFNKTDVVFDSIYSYNSTIYFDNIIVHLLYFFVRITDRSAKGCIPYFASYSKSRRNFIYENSKFSFSIFNSERFSEEELNFIEQANNWNGISPYIVYKELRFKHKKREVITYKHNKYGKYLKNIHIKIAKLFECFMAKDQFSYGYMSGKSCLDCVKKHANSKSFLKLDIQNFFGSIRSYSVGKVIFSLIFNECNNPYVLRSNIVNDVSKILKLCFFNILPLGLCISPTLSNLFMIDFDLAFNKTFKNLIYTRYVDDILISSEENNFDFSSVLEHMQNNLRLKGLKLNKDKTRVTNFNESESHIKFLGLVITGSIHDINRIKVSKNYLRKVFKLASDNYNSILNEYDSKYADKIVGMFEYIKHNDYKSYLKLINKLKKHNINRAS